MSYFNDVMKAYISHYVEVLGYQDILGAIAAEDIASREIAVRLVDFSEKFFAQVVTDEENGVRLGKIEVEVYDAEKIAATICSLVDARGYGELLNLD